MNLSSINKKIDSSFLVSLANKYETAEFLKKDPSQFMHRFCDSQPDAECVAFIAANLAFGRREQILSHVQKILSLIKNDDVSPCHWILSGLYKNYFPQSKKSFYRMYSFEQMRLFFEGIESILKESGSLGKFYQQKWENNTTKKYLHEVIAESFPCECALISRSCGGAAKKLNMFLRWMVRDNSSVDLGLWKWYSKANLLIPLDTHVMQEACKFGFIKKTSAGKIPSANLKTAVQLTNIMNEFFPGDPARADYALFGLGTDTQN